jgi:hypothetical protein
MELGEDQYFRVDLPDQRKVFSNHWVLIGSSNSGKTFWAAQQAIQSLKGPKSGRRKIVWCSAELEEDETIRKLMSSHLKKWVTGINTSQEAFETWLEKDENQGRTVQGWFDDEILPELIPEKWGHLYFDDSMDSPAHKQLMRFQNRAYRTLRHKKVGITSLQHSYAGGKFTSQAFSSVIGVVTFPGGGGRGKLQKWLSDDLGFGLRRAREVVNTFSDRGRWMFVRIWAPGALVGPKNIVLT